MAPNGWCDDGWFYLLEGATKYVLESAPSRPNVIIRALPSLALVEDDALLFEVGVEKGTLIVSGLNHRAPQGRPENEWLMARLLDHAAGFPQLKVKWPASFLTVAFVAPEGCLPGLASCAALPSTAMDKTQLDKLVGQPVDIAPWAYAWRADLAVQEKPEAYFIPRRLERINKVYRTAFTALPQDELKSLYYDMPDLLKPLLPQPKGRLQAGLLWTGGLADYQVELHWPAGVQEIPSPEAVEVRVYPTSFGWFGWTVDKILSNPEVSADRRTWTYKSDPAAKMDSAYSVRVDAATEMVAVFYEEERHRAASSLPCRASG